MVRRTLILTMLILSSLLLISCNAAPGSLPAGLTLAARVGFDGYVETGAWTPVSVIASNDGADLSGELRVTVEAFAAPPVTYARAIDLPRGSRKAVTVYVPDLSAYGRSVTVELVSGGRVVAALEEPVQAIQKTTLLIGVLSDQPGLLTPALAEVRPSSRITRVAQLTIDDLPDQPRGWEALDALVLYDVDSGQLSLEQRAALNDWVAGGGRLLIVAGLPFQRTLAGLGELSPVQAERTENAPLSVLNSYSVDAPFDAQTEAPLAVGALAPGAQALLSSDGQTLLAESTPGLGRVVYFAADPALEPLLSWPDQEALWAAALEASSTRPAWSFGFASTNWDSLRSASANIPGLSLPSILGLCAFLLAYTLLVGPVNYLVLTRLKRRELAWITVPALVLGFTLLAYITGFTLRGSQLILHQLTVVQSWSGEESARVDGVIGIWSPRRARYDIEFGQGLFARRLPATVSGGLPSPDSGDVLVAGGSTLVRGLRTDVGGVQPLLVEGSTRTAPRIEGDLRIIPEASGVRVVGDIVNYSDVALTDLRLLFGSTYASLNDLPAGGVLSVDSFLTGTESAPGALSGLDPYPLNPYGYYYYQSSLVDSISGNCWDMPADQRRCDLLYGLLLGEGRGDGLYLTGWSETPVYNVQIENASTRVEALTLHIVRMRSLVQPGQNLAEVGPGLMSWRVIEKSANVYEPAPYGLYLYTGDSVAFHWEPLIEVSAPARGLRFDIESYGFLPEGGLDAELYNFAELDWSPVTLYSGANTFDNPDFIASSGAVQLRITVNTVISGVTLDRIDLSLLY